MTRRFCYYGDEVLIKISEPVTKFDAWLRQLAEELQLTLKRKRGVGLAAPQVGVSSCICLISMLEMPEYRSQLPKSVILVNPTIVESSGIEKGDEGCLSFPGLSVNLERPARVTVEYVDLEGMPQTLEVEGIAARAAQHEIDHLNGVLLLDHLPALARMRLGREVRQMRQLIAEFKEKGL